MSSEETPQETSQTEPPSIPDQQVITADTSKIIPPEEPEPALQEESIAKDPEDQEDQEAFEQIAEPVVKEKSNNQSSIANQPEDGGEWEILVQKTRDWLNQIKLKTSRKSLIQATLSLAGIFLLVVVFSTYGKILNTISVVPLAPRLLELVGFIWIITFSSTKLLRKKDREKVFSDLKDRLKRLTSEI